MQSTTSSLKGSVTVDEYVQPLDLLPPSTGLLGRVRDELGPWRSHSAVKDVTVDVDDQGAVRITFEVFGAAAARCDLPVAMWISALRGCRVVVHHRVVDHESPWTPASVRVMDQRRRSTTIPPGTPDCLPTGAAGDEPRSVLTACPGDGCKDYADTPPPPVAHIETHSDMPANT